MDVEFTVTARDQSEHACVSRAMAEDLVCKYETLEKARSPSAPDLLLAPYTTTSREQFLAAGLWTQPALAQPPANRFGVQCKLRLIAQLEAVRIRWRERSRSSAIRGWDGSWRLERSCR